MDLVNQDSLLTKFSNLIWQKNIVLLFPIFRGLVFQNWSAFLGALRKRLGFLRWFFLVFTQANAAALFLWAISCYQLAASSDVIGPRFLVLKVRKIYLFCGRSLDSES